MGFNVKLLNLKNSSRYLLVKRALTHRGLILSEVFMCDKEEIMVDFGSTRRNRVDQ